MAYVFRLRERNNFTVTAINTLRFPVNQAWTVAPSYVIVKVYTPRGALIYHGKNHAAGDVVVVSLPLLGGAAIQGKYQVTYETQVDNFYDEPVLSLNVKTATVDAYADGFTSRFYASDITGWGDYPVSSRQWRIVPPTGMSELIGSSTSLEYLPNIYSGVYTIYFGGDYSYTNGDVVVYDATAYQEQVKVYALNEQTVMVWVKAYLDEYTVNLSDNPIQAKLQQPTAARISMLLYIYYKHIRYAEYEDAYLALEELRAMLTPDVEPVEGVMFPFSGQSGADHTHSNLAVLDGFTISGSDLVWNGTVIGSYTPDFTVKVNAGDTPGFLEAKIDSVTLAVEDDKLRVKDEYIKDRVDGTSVKYDDLTNKIYVEFTSSVTGGIKWENSRVYPEFDVVSYGDPVKFYFSLESGNVGNTPDSSPTKWELVPASGLEHAQNTDFRFSNKYATTNLSSASAGILTVEWKSNNVIIVTQDDATNELIGIVATTTKTATTVDLENHDVTIHVIASVGVTIKHSVIEANPTSIKFNNQGRDLVFSSGVDWVRYRYNAYTKQFDMVATSLPSATDEIATIKNNLEGDDSVYKRFSTDYKEFGAVKRRVAITTTTTNLNALMEAGDYYGVWTDHPDQVEGSEGEPTAGWVRVVSAIAEGDLVTIQFWLGTGHVVDTGVTPFSPAGYARIYDGTSWGAWVASDVTLAHADITNKLGNGEYHLSEAERDAAIRRGTATVTGLIHPDDFVVFRDKQAAITPGTHLSFAGATLNVDLTDGRLLSKDGDTLNVIDTVKETDDGATDDEHNWSAAKIIAYIAGSEEDGTFSKSYTIVIPAGADLATKLGLAGLIAPDGWLIGAIGGTNGDLEITHGLGQTPVAVAVYSVTAGVKSRLEGNNAYSSYESNTTDDKLVLYAYAGTSAQTEIRIIF